MIGLILCFSLAVGCLAQIGLPHKCESPRLMTGRLSLTTQSEKLSAYAKYTYDAWGKRIRFREIGSYENETFHVDALLLYREGLVYKINTRNHTCCKKRLRTHFHPLHIPEGASLLGQAVLGSSSMPGQGLLVNTWMGEMMLNMTEKAKYVNTVTEFGCVPVSTLFHTSKTGWMITSFFDNVLGITDPQHLIPPSFCKEAELNEDNGEEPVDFYSVLFE